VKRVVTYIFIDCPFFPSLKSDVPCQKWFNLLAGSSSPLIAGGGHILTQPPMRLGAGRHSSPTCL